MNISWSRSEDPDGSVQKYMVSGITEKERKKLGETAATGFRLEDRSGYIFLEVIAIDNLGGRSKPARVRVGPLEKMLDVSTGIIYPMGHLGDMAGMGLGATMTLTWKDIFMPGVFAGISAGFYYLPGKEYTDEIVKETRRVFLVPLYMKAGYRFIMTEKLSLSPYLCAGGIYIDMPYTEKNIASLEDEQMHLATFGPAGEAGFSVQYMLSGPVTIALKAGQGLLFKKEMFDYPFTRLEIGAGITL